MLKILCTLLFISSLTYSQQPPRPAGEGEKIWDKLAVDAATKTKIQEIMKGSRKEKQLLSIEMNKKEIELKEILMQGTDLERIKKNCTERGNIWASMQVTEFKFDAEIRKLLTPAQWEKYVAFKLSRNNKHTPPNMGPKKAKTGAPHPVKAAPRPPADGL